MILKFIYIVVLLVIKMQNFTLILNSLKNLREKKEAPTNYLLKLFFW